jgi:hypothetical protein
LEELFSKGFVENCTGYLLENNSSISVDICERYLQKAERSIYPAAPVTSVEYVNIEGFNLELRHFRCFIRCNTSKSKEIISMLVNKELQTMKKGLKN